MTEPTHLSLFSGIGGLDLAAEWAGFRTIGQCEWAEYPTKVLEKHWPDVPRWKDIKTLTKESFYAKTGLHTVDVISGGFPCQPFSASGKQNGESDERYLWPEMLRVISDLKPKWVVGENVDGLLSAKYDETLENIVIGLENESYYVRIYSYEAAVVGAPHRRRRTFIVADSNFIRWQNNTAEYGLNKAIPAKRAPTTFNHDFTAERIYRLPDSDCIRRDDGIPDTMDRIKCLGNAVVPQQAYPIFCAIRDCENILYEESKQND